MNNFTGGCIRIMEIDNSDVTILLGGLIDRLTNA
jgi:transcriptional regulator CtsR